MIQGALLGVLIIALSGYIYNTTYIRRKFRVASFDSTHILYVSLFAGIIFLIISAIIFSLLWPYTSKSSEIFSFIAVPFPNITQTQFNYYSILLTSILLSFISSHALNIYHIRGFVLFYQFAAFNKRRKLARLKPDNEKPLKVRKEKANFFKNFKQTCRRHFQLKAFLEDKLELIEYKTQNSDQFVSHLIESYMTPNPILISLNNRRCYVCLVHKFNIPNDHKTIQEVAIIPFYSGYRDKEDMCFEITTVYTEVLDIFTNKNKAENANVILNSYKITIPFSSIDSIANFQINRYRNFKTMENERRNEIYQSRGKESEQ